MNWVGGSRTRVLIKQERRKQKEYFEKKRLKSKMKLLGVSSPVKNSTVSLDLLNLYMVNHISCQKKTPETVRKPIHVNMYRDIKMPLRKHNLELPMSPDCVPSNLCIDDTENRQGSKKQLAPVQVLFFFFQLSKVNYSNSLVSKLYENQDVLSPSYKTAQYGSLFERLNSPGNCSFLTGRSVVVMGEECGSMDEQRQSDFITEKQSAQHIWGENRREASHFLEDVNQSKAHLISENYDSFISENIINLLSIDQQRIRKTFDKCDCDSMGDASAITSSDKNDSTDRCIRSIFTDPELTFSNSTFNKTSYPEKYQPSEYQKEYNNNERNILSTSFEKDCYVASSEKKGKFESDYQEKIPQNESQKYPVKHMGDISLEELHSKQSWDFGFGEPSEDEDQILQQIEESNRRSIRIKETTNNFYPEGMPKLPHGSIIRNNTKNQNQNENLHHFSMKNNTDQFPQSQCNSTHILQNKTSDNCILQVARCDAWVQTDSEPVMEEKLDAAVQCDIISKCKCRSNVSPLCNVERCSENVNADTTGGQETLKNN
ncbi:regulator of DNA class I crossover intermediates 1 isoform X6 [Canis aureus]